MELMETLGQIAGLGGIAIGSFLMMGRDILRKKIFPSLTKAQSFKILNTLILLTWSLSVIGLAGWIYLESVKSNKSEHVETGIPNTGRLSDADIISKTDELIAILNRRAERIVTYLENKKNNSSILFNNDYQGIDDVVDNFKRLHEAHITHLKAGRFIAAHEILIEINALSFMDKVKSRAKITYAINSMGHSYGNIITLYVANEYAFFFDVGKFKPSPDERTTNKRGPGYDPSHLMANLIDTNEIYRIILESDAL